MSLLYNSDVVVLISFSIFIGIVIYAGVPGMITGALDARAKKIADDLEEARSLAEEARKTFADFERRQRDVETMAADIVAKAKLAAEQAAAEAHRELEASVQRRLRAAEEQAQMAEASAVKAVRDRAVEVAVAAAAEVIAKRMTVAQTEALVQKSIETVEAKLH